VVCGANSGSRLRYATAIGFYRRKNTGSRIRARGVTIIGDDIKSQVGAYDSTSVLTRLFADRVHAGETIN
jgi:hypothetical protein